MTDDSVAPAPRPVLKLSLQVWALFALVFAALYFAFQDGANFSARWIWFRPEYSHGMLIPFIAAFLIYQRREQLEKISFNGSWWGFGLLLVAIAVNIAGTFGALYIVQQYAVVLAIYGLVLALTGWSAFRVIWVPLILLWFMVPLPEFLYQSLSAKLQLISSQLGVWVIRRFGITVFLDGNVIDLGAMKLQVAEACSGLRYLFPLMTLGFVMACFFQAAFWKRTVLFLSTIPITIFMNSLRIGLIGVTVEHWGVRMAEGFLHDFEGWIIFMACGVLLILEIVLLSRLGRDKRPWRQIFGVELPAPLPAGTTQIPRPLNKTFLAACAVLVVAAVAYQATPEQSLTIPRRESFVDFPDRIGGWMADKQPMDVAYRDELKVDDYVMAQYHEARRPGIEIYMAWYDTQEAGRSTHSPATCLPAGGWLIESMTQLGLPSISVLGHPLRVNRVLIRSGNSYQLVYYFFKQRQRILTNEYAVKWYLFWDALTQHRTDGALVRFITPVDQGEDVPRAEARLQNFVAEAAGKLGPFLPD